MKYEPVIDRSKWDGMTHPERDAFVHQDVLDGTGDPPPYSTEYGSAVLIEQKLGLLYKFDYYSILHGDPAVMWHCRVTSKVESMQSGYTWAAATYAEALCLATLHAMDLLEMHDLRDLRSLD